MILNRSIAPPVRQPGGISFEIAEPLKLDNGWPVYCIDESEQDVLRLEFTYDAGTWDQPKPLIAYSTVRMLTEGAGGRSAREIHEIMQSHGAYIDTQNDHHSSSLTLYVLHKHLKTILPVLGDILYRPDFPEKEMEVLKNKTLQDHRINLEKVQYLARRSFLKALYGQGHPYGKMLHEEDIKALCTEDLRDYYLAHYPGKGKLILAGKIPDNIFGLLNEILPERSNSRFSRKYDYEFIEAESGRQHITKKGALQSALRVGRPLFNMAHEDFPAFSVLNTILGAYFGSRLMSNLREDKGYTYGINSGIVSMRKHGYFFIASQVGAEHQENALKEIRNEIDRLRNELVPEDELELVRNYSLGSLARSFDGAFAKADRLHALLDLGLDSSYIERRIDTIRNISSEELRSLAQKYLDPNQMLELSVGP